MVRGVLLEGRVLLSTVTFAPPQIYNLNPTPRDTAIADFNGDGFPDIAAVISGGTQVGVLLNNGDGTFTRAPYIPGRAPSLSRSRRRISTMTGTLTWLAVGMPT